MSKLISNVPKVFERYQNQAFRSNDIEDGNTENDTPQGKIYTSELSAADDYNIDYSASIVSVTPAIYITGNLYNYTVRIKYEATLEPSATVPGYFGSNLIKPNDPFLITGIHDWIRGFVNQIVAVKVSNITPSVFEFDCTLYCTIVQGDPLNISIATSKFLWKRLLFNDFSNFDDNYPPTDIKVSYNTTNFDTYLYWKNINLSSRRHAIQFRKTNDTDTIVERYINTYGDNVNFTGSLQPIIDVNTGDVSTVQIVNPGKNLSYHRSVNFLGNGNGSCFSIVPITTDGSLPIHEYEVVNVPMTSLTSITQTTPFGQPIDGIGTITAPGTGMTNGIYGPILQLSNTGNGINATFRVRVTGGVVTGVIALTGGTNYQLSDVITLDAGLFGGISGVDDVSFSPATLIATQYTGASGITLSGAGTGAIFTVEYDSTGNILITVDDPGFGYLPGDNLQISFTDVGGAPATDINFQVDSFSNIIYLRSLSTNYGYSNSYAYPEPSTYIEGLPGISFDKYFANTLFQISDGVFEVTIGYAEDTTTTPVIPAGWVSTVIGTRVKVHNGVFRISTNLTTPVTFISGSNKISLGLNDYLPSYFVGTKVTDTGSALPANTYIETISNNSITLSNNALVSGSFTLTLTGIGKNYTNKTRATIIEKEKSAQFYLDPAIEVIYTGDFLTTPEYGISIAGITSENMKNYTDWSEEIYFKGSI
jgi:hypothetical protein